MHLPLVAIALAASLASSTPLSSPAAPALAKRGCFSGGDSWGSSKSDALDAAKKACSGGLAAAYAGSTRSHLRPAEYTQSSAPRDC
jgi:hypothetical protein